MAMLWTVRSGTRAVRALVSVAHRHPFRARFADVGHSTLIARVARNAGPFLLSSPDDMQCNPGRTSQRLGSIWASRAWPDG